MIFKLNTNIDEDICLDLSEERATGDIESVIGEFCGGIVSFLIDFAFQLNCNNLKQTKVLTDICLSCIKESINEIFEEVFYNEGTEEDNETSEEKIDDLTTQLLEVGFTEDEICSVIKMIQSMETTNDCIKEILGQYNNELNSEENP